MSNQISPVPSTRPHTLGSHLQVNIPDSEAIDPDILFGQLNHGFVGRVVDRWVELFDDDAQTSPTLEYVYLLRATSYSDDPPEEIIVRHAHLH